MLYKLTMIKKKSRIEKRNVPLADAIKKARLWVLLGYNFDIQEEES